MLIVDDDPMVFPLIEQFLPNLYFELDHALDGRSGLEKIEKCLPDVLLLDLIVPLGQTYNIHTGHTGTNSACSQGGDAVSYAVKSLTNGWDQLTVAPATGCLAVGDEILLISMNGNGTEYVNIGTFEFLRVGGINEDTV